MSVLKTIGMVVGGLVILALVFVGYLNWLDSRKEKTFATCKLNYIQANPSYTDLGADELLRQADFLMACMEAGGYKANIQHCTSYNLHGAIPWCFDTGFFP